MRVFCAGLGRFAAVVLVPAAPAPCAQAYGPAAEATGQGAPPVGTPSTPAIPDELAAAAARAVSGNPAMRAARLANRAAALDVRSARWLRAPSVSVNAFGFEGGTAVVRGDNLTANLVVDQPIWQGGRITGAIERARAAERQSEALTDETG